MDISQIKIEISAETNGELPFSKCGEVFVTKNGKFRWECILCGKKFENQKFVDHILQNHLKLDGRGITGELSNKDQRSNHYLSVNSENFEDIQEKVFMDEPCDNILTDTSLSNKKQIKVCLKRNIKLENYLKRVPSDCSKIVKKKRARNYKCSNCNEKFNRKLLLRDHIKNIHKKDGISAHNPMTKSKLFTKHTEDNPVIDEDIVIDCNAMLDNELSDHNCSVSEKSKNSVKPVFNEDATGIEQSTYSLGKFKISELEDNLEECSTKQEKAHLAFGTNQENPDDSKSSTNKTKKNRTQKNYKREKHVCEVCGKEASSKYNLINHVKHRHNAERTKYPCDKCEKLFVRKESLENHTKNYHLKDKPFICHIDMCESSFSNERSLKNHQAFHIRERKFVCSECGKKYLHKSKLDVHFKMYHVLGRIHQCKVCSKGFYDIYTLRGHMICHTGEKPFACDECPARFPREKALQWHKKVHSGIKDFICKVCGQAYHLFTGLYAHMKTHGIKYNNKIEKGILPIEQVLKEKTNPPKKEILEQFYEKE